MVAIITGILPKSIFALKSLFHDQYRGYYGTYYVYSYRNFVKDGDNKIVVTTHLDILRRFFSNPKVTIRTEPSLNMPAMKFDGQIILTERNMFLLAKPPGRKEVYTSIFYTQVRKDTMMFGLFCALNPVFEPMGGIAVLSSMKLEDDEVRRLLGNNRNILVSHEDRRKIDHLLAEK